MDDDKITSRRSHTNSLSAPWGLSVISLLLVAVRVRDERIRRLEQFNRSLAVELDRVTGTRAQVGRRAA